MREIVSTSASSSSRGPLTDISDATNNRQVVMTTNEISDIVKNVCDIRQSNQPKPKRTTTARVDQAPTKSTRGRKPLPRDENGKIVRPNLTME